jgi:hypothetical protein
MSVYEIWTLLTFKMGFKQNSFKALCVYPYECINLSVYPNSYNFKILKFRTFGTMCIGKP